MGGVTPLHIEGKIDKYKIEDKQYGKQVWNRGNG